MVESIKKIFSTNNFILLYKSQIILAAKIVIAAGLLFYLINSVNINEITYAIENANINLILFALFLSLLNLYLQFYKWKLTSNFVLNENQNTKILVSLFHGFSAGAFTPARAGEYFGRALVFKDRSLLSVTLATLLDKLFLLIVVAFVGSLSSILFLHYYYKISYYITVSLFLIVFILFYLFLLMIFNSGFWNHIFFKKLRTAKKLNWLFEKLNLFYSLDKRYATKMMIASFILYSCFVFQYALLVAAFSNQQNYIDYIWAGNLVMFAKTIIPPVSFGELGIREGASVYFIKQVGETASTGFNASIFLFLINILLPSLVGMILLLKRNHD